MPCKVTQLLLYWWCLPSKVNFPKQERQSSRGSIGECSKKVETRSFRVLVALQRLRSRLWRVSVVRRAHDEADHRLVEKVAFERRREVHHVPCSFFVQLHLLPQASPLDSLLFFLALHGILGKLKILAKVF